MGQILSRPSSSFLGRIGVYSITNKVNNKRYIGSSTNLGRRKTSHFTCLRKGKGHNQHLQYSYNKFGESSFIFAVIEYCTKEELLVREQFYVDTLKPEYNVRPKCESNAGVPCSEARRAKLQKAVLVYNLEGIFKYKYSSITEASTTLALATAQICSVLKGTPRSAGGYYFIYYNGMDIPETAFSRPRIPNNRNAIPVEIYAGENLIGTFKSKTEAARYLEICPSQFLLILNGIYHNKNKNSKVPRYTSKSITHETNI